MQTRGVRAAAPRQRAGGSRSILDLVRRTRNNRDVSGFNDRASHRTEFAAAWRRAGGCRATGDQQVRGSSGGRRGTPLAVCLAFVVFICPATETRADESSPTSPLHTFLGLDAETGEMLPPGRSGTMSRDGGAAAAKESDENSEAEITLEGREDLLRLLKQADEGSLSELLESVGLGEGNGAPLIAWATRLGWFLSLALLAWPASILLGELLAALGRRRRTRALPRAAETPPSPSRVAPGDRP